LALWQETSVYLSSEAELKFVRITSRLVIAAKLLNGFTYVLAATHQIGCHYPAIGGQVACAFLYSDPNGREVFSVTDMNDNLPIPNVGETLKLGRNRYVVQSVKMVESRIANALRQCRICVMLVEDIAQAAV
jgi:hypothetical protein